MIIEAVLGALILFGFVFFTLAKYSQESKFLENKQSLYTLTTYLGDIIQHNETIIAAILNKNAQNVNAALQDELKRMKINLTTFVQIDSFDENLLMPPCYLKDEPLNKEVYSIQRIISANNTHYSPKRVCIFIVKKL